MKKLLYLVSIILLLSTSVVKADFMADIHKKNAKKSQQTCLGSSKWAGKSCNTAGKIWLTKLNNKKKALKWFKIGCDRKGYFQACVNYKKHSKK